MGCFGCNRAVIVCLFISIICFHGWAQQHAVDPQTELYQYLDEWEGAGYVRWLPELRPYSEPQLAAILREVVRNGDVETARTAQGYLDIVTNPLHLKGGGGLSVLTKQSSYELQPYLQFLASGTVLRHVFFSADATGWIVRKRKDNSHAASTAYVNNRNTLLPQGERIPYDILNDEAGFTVMDQTFYTLLDLRSGVTIGKANLFVQAGIMRRSFGPFHADSIVLSKNAPASPNIVFHYNTPRKRFTYTAGLLSLRAQALYEQINTADDRNQATTIFQKDDVSIYRVLQAEGFDDEEGPGKYLHFQMYKILLGRWGTLSFFETVVFGPTFQPAYLVPLKLLWYTQGLTSFSANSLLGFNVVSQIGRVRIPFTVYLDDANFNDIVRVRLDTKYKLGAQLGFVWTPLGGQDGHMLRQLSADYTMIAPYMYSHDGAGMYSTDFHYTNYVHGKTSLGSALAPNSDRFALSLRLQPLRVLSTELSAVMIRHANASEGVLSGYGNNGSIYDDGRHIEFHPRAAASGESAAAQRSVPDSNGNTAAVKQGRLSFQEKFPFLTQDTIQYTYQLAAKLSLDVPLFTKTVVEGRYLFEYIRSPIRYHWNSTTLTGETIKLADEQNHYVFLQVRMLL